MPTLDELNQRVGQLRAKETLAKERLAQIKEELAAEGIDIDDTDAAKAKLREKVNSYRAKRDRYIRRATVVLDKYDQHARSQR